MLGNASRNSHLFLLVHCSSKGKRLEEQGTPFQKFCCAKRPAGFCEFRDIQRMLCFPLEVPPDFSAKASSCHGTSVLTLGDRISDHTQTEG